MKNMLLRKHFSKSGFCVFLTNTKFALTFTLHKIINEPGIMNVHIVNVIAYHREFALEKYGKQIPMSLYSRYGATSNNGGMVPSIARNQPQAKPQTTCNMFNQQKH